MSDDVLRMPRLSDSMSEATVIAWLKEPGETFTRGDPLVEIETDKATVVYEAEADGILEEILVAEGVTAGLGDPIARLASNGTADTTARLGSGPVSVPGSAATGSSRTPTPGRRAAISRARATPVARRTAAQFAIPLHELTGTGPGGRIRKLDVLRASPGANATADALRGATTVVPLTPTQETIARRMTKSRTEIPSFDVVVDADVSTLVELRRGAEQQLETRPSVNDFVIKAAALALRRFPAFNSFFIDGRVESHDRVNVGFAVATEESLLVPAVVDADRKSIGAIASETRHLAERARSRSLTPDELSAGTFTVSNLGTFDVRSFTAVINEPQVAILAVGGATRSFVETATNVGAFRDLVTLTLTSDHRAVYGADAARFLAHIRQLLEHPLALLVS
jgi:pyruvate dehydrogenase E2 component (dihydrolipoamide acetyltransferase)